MSPQETSMGESRDRFPETAGSILADPNLPPAERQARLDRLCSRYWRPVYAFIRVFHGRSIEDSKDLTQEFFRHLVESDVISKYRPREGRFRPYLKGTLRNFLMSERRGASAQKRGGGSVILSLDAKGIDEDALKSAAGASPDGFFDRQWSEEVVAEGIVRLRSALLAEGKQVHFQVYEEQDLVPPGQDKPTYEESAAHLGISVSDVRNHLHLARTRLEQIIVQVVAEYVSTPEELDEEMRDLFHG